MKLYNYMFNIWFITFYSITDRHFFHHFFIQHTSLHILFASRFFAHAFSIEHFLNDGACFHSRWLQFKTKRRLSGDIFHAVCSMMVSEQWTRGAWAAERQTQGNYGPVVVKIRLPRMFYYSTFLWPAPFCCETFLFDFTFFTIIACINRDTASEKERDVMRYVHLQSL